MCPKNFHILFHLILMTIPLNTIHHFWEGGEVGWKHRAVAFYQGKISGCAFRFMLVIAALMRQRKTRVIQ